MYSPEKVAEWNVRSSSHEYQKAYDDITRNLPTNPNLLYLDVACGKGEILKRIQRKFKYRSLLGTDNSLEMLQTAQENLRTYGSKVKIVTSLPKLDNHSTTLFLDDLLESKVPDESADVTIFTFPELGRNYNPLPIDRMLRGHFLSKFGEFDHSCYVDLLITLRANYQLSRITKNNGNIAVAEYDISMGKNSEYDQFRIRTLESLWNLFDVELKKHLFFESPKVWADTIDASEGDDKLKDAKKGYRLFLMRKNVKCR